MTAEVDVHRDACESEVLKGEEGNQNVNVIGNGNRISKDDGDGSYVFVTGSDGVASGESDLTNGHCSVQNNGGGGLHLELKGEEGESGVVVVVDNPQSDSLNKAAAEESTHPSDPEIALENSHLQSEACQQLAEEVPVEDASRDLLQDSEQDSLTSQADTKLDKEIVGDPESKENGDGLLACDAHDSTLASIAEQNGSSDDGQALAADSVEVELHLETQVVNGTVSDENGDELPSVDAPGSVSDPIVTNHLVDTTEKNNGTCEENLAANVDVRESASEPIAEKVNGLCEENGKIVADNVEVQKQLETQVVNGPVSDKSGDESLTVHVHEESISEPIVTSLLADTPEENGSCENGKVLAASVEVEKQLETQVVSGPISDKSPVSDKSGDESLTVHAHEESISKPIVTSHLADTPEENWSCENGKVLAASVEVEKQLETQVVSGPISDKSGDDLPIVQAHQENMSEPIVTEYMVDTPEENGSCEKASVCENVQAHQENMSEPIVTEYMVDTPEENGSCEKASVCENVPVENGESFATVADSDTMVNVENGDSLPTKDDSTCTIGEGTPETDVEKLDEKHSENPKPCPLEHSKSELEAESAPIKVDTFSSFSANDVISEPNSKSEIEAEIASVVDDALSGCPASDAISEPNLKSEIESVVDDSLSSCLANDAISEPISKSECESEIPPVVDDTLSSFPADDATQEPKTSDDSIDCEKTVSNDAMDVADSGLSNLETECAASPPISFADNNGKPALQINGSVENDATLPASSDADESSIVTDDRPGSEVQSMSAERSSAIAADDGNASESRLLNDSSVENGRLNCISDDVQIESDVKSTHQEEEVECTDGIHRSEVSTSRQEVPTVVSLEGLDKVVEVEKRPFYFLIRIPRNDDENLKEQIKHAQLLVEEKTKGRDAIRSKMQMQRATCKEYKLKFEAAISEERAAQELLKSKRREMDSVQFMINKVKDAQSVEEMANTIRHMEHTMAHETLPLKEEKQYIRDIKQLKQRRDQLSYSLGKQDEVQQALDQKDHIEERIKNLRKEMDQLRANLLKAQEVTQAARKKFSGENDMLHELQYQFEVADATRQEAYVHLQSLRKQNYEKTKHFWRYKNDAKAANDLALSGDKEQLQHLCINQVETIMELWNKDDDFRKEYIKCNTRSTLRRLRTLDGRSLGPDEEPPVIPDIVRVTRHNMATAVVPTPEPEKRVAIVESEEPNDKSAMEIVEQTNEIAKNKKPVKVASSGISQATVSGRNVIEEEKVEGPKPTKEEEELARKEEELRKEEAAARLREQHRLEEKAKAKEAMERKKRIAEKSQARAAIKAQKEAEEKEKEREKRVRKKERKKASATKATNGISEGESAPEPSPETTSLTPLESEAKEKPMTITKRSQKAPQFTKQTKVKSIPLPLRNRSKRRMQPWLWVLVTVVAILGLFLLGNGGSFSFKSMFERFY